MKKIFVLFLALFVVGCQKDEPYKERPLEQIYHEAMSHFKSADYNKAAKTFAEVERQHPYSAWATKAQLMSAFCYFLSLDYEDSLRMLDVFIQYHPTHKDIAYAYYLKGMCYYYQVLSADRDPEPPYLAKEVFTELSQKFKDSVYAKDVSRRMAFINDLLAGHEMMVGRYYQNIGNFLSAYNRFKTVKESYSDTDQAPEAYYRMIESLKALGLTEEIKKVFSEAIARFPKNNWTKKAKIFISS